MYYIVCDVFNLVKVVIIVEKRVEVVLSPVEAMEFSRLEMNSVVRLDLHAGNPPSNVNFPLNLYVLKPLLPKAVLTKRSATPGNGARCRSRREYAINARFTHLVIAFWIDHIFHALIEVPHRLADGANV